MLNSILVVNGVLRFEVYETIIENKQSVSCYDN